jgi:glucokinase
LAYRRLDLERRWSGTVDSCLAVDIGGTKLAAGIVNAAGELLAHQQVPTPKDADAEGLFGVLADLVIKVASGQGGSVGGGPSRVGSVVGYETGELLACGVGCGGPMSDGGEEVSPLNIPGWVRFPLRSSLESLTGLKVTVDNDAKALALGEGWVGAAKGRRNFMGMVVSTGVGGGIVVDGRLLDGSSGNAGHIGHVIVEPGGRQCRCGARGCLEAEASGSAIAEMTGRPPAEANSELVSRTGRLVGMAVASVTNLLDLELTGIAGSVALGFGTPFFAAASSELAARSRISFTSDARIEPAGLGSSGPLIGAGAVAWRALDRQVVGTVSSEGN